MRALMSRPFTVALTRQDDTPDGWSELTVEVNGHVVARSVLSPLDFETDWFAAVSRWCHDEILRYC
jgi:hypothetical protein